MRHGRILRNLVSSLSSSFSFPFFSFPFLSPVSSLLDSGTHLVFGLGIFSLPPSLFVSSDINALVLSSAIHSFVLSCFDSFMDVYGVSNHGCIDSFFFFLFLVPRKFASHSPLHSFIV